MIHVEISEELSVSPDLIQWVEQVAAKTLSLSGIVINTVDLTIELGSDPQIQALNRDFLGNDKPTDVLSFPSGGEKDPETGNDYLGDIFISLSRASEQAQKAGHPVDAEIALLTVHGVLHLLGHDHGTPGEKTRMWDIQNQVLTSLDVHLAALPGEDANE